MKHGWGKDLSFIRANPCPSVANLSPFTPLHMLPRFLTLGLALVLSLSARAAEPFEIKNGDRVLFLGDTLLEREGTHGYLETRMHQQFPDRTFTVRNLAFSADTPRGWSRASFDPAAKGFERLKEQLAVVKPTVVFLGYGMAASLQEITDRSGDPTLNPDPARYGAEPMSAVRFKKELGELMDAINEVAAVPAVTPANAGNDRASLSGTAVRGTATAAEQSAASTTAEAAVASSKPNPRDAAGGQHAAKVRFVLLSPIRHEDLRSTRPNLPDPTRHNELLALYSKAIEELAQERGGRFVPTQNLQKAVREQIDSLSGFSKGLGNAFPSAKVVVSLPMLTDNGIHLHDQGYGALAGFVSEQLFGSAPVSGPPNIDASLGLRAAIIRKNELFFHQWRPANSTYLFGFRKHEQGQNAKEMPMFDPLIDAAEAAIDRLKKTPATTPKTASAQPDAAPAKPAPLTSGPTLPKPDFTVEEGYQIELWAENPLLYKPTQMNWDTQGRLWVASSALYPQIAPGGEATDNILVLEDTNGDGQAEKSTVFTGGLIIPTGVQPVYMPGADGKTRFGCYVGQSTELLYFEDTDGDGQADTKRILLSGFGTEDTHHIIHTLKRGPDRRLYFNQSVYIHSHLETPWGVVRLNSGGVFAWDPRTEKVEVVSKGLWNTWGLQFDEWGEIFQTDGAGSTGITWSFPGATFAPFEGSRRTLQSISPGSYPKFAGLELLHSPHFPADWQGNAITCDFRAHRVVRFGVTDLAIGEKPQAGFTTKEMPDLVRTSDVAFRPIDVKMGPDGAIYIADWSNPVINHGEVDFRDPRRDKTNGRIWRVSKKGAAPVKWQPLTEKKNAELLDGLLSPSLWEREQSREVLGRRLVMEVESRKSASRTSGAVHLGAGDQDHLGELEAWYRKEPTDARLREVTFLESTFITVGWSRFQDLIASPDARMHALVPRLMSTMTARARSPISRPPTVTTPTDGPTPQRNLWSLPKLALDPHPRVQLRTLRALALMPSVQSVDLILDTAVKKKDDPFLEYAAWLSINDLAPYWTQAIAQGEWKLGGREAQLEYGLSAIDPTLAGATLAKLLADGQIGLTKGPWIELLGRAGGPEELAALYESLIISFAGDCCPGRPMTAKRATAISEEQGVRIVAALVEAARVRNIRPEGELSVAGLVPHSPKALAPGLLQLAGLWKTKDALEVLPAAANGSDTPQRVAAIEGLRALGGPAAIKALEALCAPAQSFGIRRTALTALASVKLASATPFIPAILKDAPNEAESLATWRGLLAVQNGANVLAKQVADGAWAKDLPKTNLTAGVRAAREGGRKAQPLLAALTPIAGVTTAPTAPADYKDLAARAKQNGDPAQGELIYRRAASGCVTCHAIGGAGGIVGPSLTSIGASAPADYIIESMLAPNAKVKEGYNAVTLKLKDGTEATGIQARETAQEVILRNIAGQETAVPKASITGKTDVGSIMPMGLMETLSDREKLNLYAFLSELGKPGPYDASKGGVARVWRMYSAAQEPQALKQETKDFPPFLYSNVDGRVSQAVFTEALPMIGEVGGHFYVSAQFQVATGGKTRFTFAGISTAWLDGQPLAIASEPNPAPTLTPGVHTLTVKIDRSAIPAILRAEAEGVNFLGN